MDTTRLWLVKWTLHTQTTHTQLNYDEQQAEHFLDVAHISVVCRNTHLSRLQERQRQVQVIC